MSASKNRTRDEARDRDRARAHRIARIARAIDRRARIARARIARAIDRARTRDEARNVIWVQLVYVNDVMEVFMHRFNLDDAPRHLYDTIKNNLTKNVWRYNNVYAGDGLLGMEGLAIEDDHSDYEQECAEQVFEYLAGKMDAWNSPDPDEYPDTYKTKAPHDVCITMRSPN